MQVNSNDGLEIYSDQAKYFKNKKLLILNGNVIIKDKSQDIIIRAKLSNMKKV